jgi:translocation and assembly module TamB
MTEQTPKIKRNIASRLLRIMLKTILFLLLFFIVLVLLIQTAPVQNFIRGKAVTWLQDKLKTRVEVGRIHIGFPKDVVLENIYIEDLSKDTLFSGGKIRGDISLFKLIKGNIELNDVWLDNITVKVKRELPDTTFNFQFIIDAFTSKEKTPEPVSKDTSNNFTIKAVNLNKVRLVYKDTITGNDAETMIGHFETKLSVFDLNKMRFDVPSFKVYGLTAKIYQSKPLVNTETESKDMADAKEPFPLQINVKEVSLEKINIDYRNDVSSFYSRLDLDKLLVHPDKIDLANRVIDIDDFLLSGTDAAIHLGKTQQAKIVEKETKQEINAQAEAGWKITATSLKLEHNNLKFDNDNQQLQKKGIDYAHLNAKNVTVHLNKFFFSSDSVSGNLSEASLFEKSGLNLEQLQAEFAYGNKGASLKDLHLKTPGTELQREAAIHYASLESLKKDFKNAEVAISLQKSKVQVKDILIFAPSLSSQTALSNPNATLYINSDIHGRIADLKIGELQLSGLNDTKVNVSGTLKGLPDINTLNADLTIRSLQSTKKDILSFVPASALPQNITIPDQFNLSGNIKGGKEDFSTKLLLHTNMGDAAIQATGKNITDKVRSAYDVRIETKQLDLGTILKQKDLLGPVTAIFTVKGTGIDKTTANAILEGTVQSAVIKQYTYHNLSLNGSIADQQVKIKTGISDPNIDFTLDASADLSSQYPSVALHTMIDSIKPGPLHLIDDNIVYRGKIDADFPLTNPDSLEGNLSVTNSLLVKDSLRIKMDTILLAAGHSDSGQFINLSSDVAYAVLQGRYKITELGTIFRQSIEPYFSVAKKDSGKLKDPYDFTLNAKLMNAPVLKTFLPGLTKMDSVTLTSRFSDHNGWNADLNVSAFAMDDNRIHDLAVHAGTSTDALAVQAHVKQLTSGNSIALFNTTLDASVKDNKIDFIINIHDKADKDKYHLSGLFEQPDTGTYAFSLKKDSLLLNYNSWNISSGNKIEIGKEYIAATNFNIDREGQHLGINSTSASQKNSPLEVAFTNFKLETITAFVQSDSTLIGGVLNGKAVVSDLPKSFVFTSDLTINDLNVKKDTAGNLKVMVNNKTPDTYNADITLTGRGNEVQINGNYYPKQPENNFDLILDLKKLPLTTVQALSDGAIREAAGTVNGRFTVKGNSKHPNINGDLNFAQATFIPSQLNTRFTIENEKIQVNEQGISFNQFSIKDSTGNKLTLNGNAATTNFTNYNFDFTIRATNFQALNSTKKDNKLFYGQLFFNTNLNVKGTESAPVIDGRLTVNEKTKLTVVLPQEDPGVADRDGVVVFINKDAPANDSLFLKAYDSLNTSSFKGMDLSVNVDIKKEANLTLIVDQGSGDFLNVRGEALLTAGVDPSGKITMAGSYELEDGAYQLTFNLLRKKFNIQKGSKIVWGGEPTQADVNIKAAYEVNTPPLDLIKNEFVLADNVRNTYLQKLPFQVFLKMTGKLLQPQISFDIVLPDNKGYNVSPDIVTNVKTKLDMLRQDEGELNKQVFALLLLNRFVGENPFNSSTSTNAGTLVRQSASKLLTEQLNRLAENLVQGVDLNFDVQSSDDYTTGERKDRTDLNVGLSKKLLNDRLTVTVGSNFELEGPQNSNQNSSNIAGNVALNYRLSKDGRYVLRAYRKNEYQGVLDGYVVETGVGFIITIDYNKFKEIFQKKQQRTRRNQNNPDKKITGATSQTTSENP